MGRPIAAPVRRGSTLVVALVLTALLSLLGLSYLLTSNLNPDRLAAASGARMASALQDGLLAARAELGKPGATTSILRLRGTWFTRQEAGAPQLEVAVQDVTPSPRPPSGWELGALNQSGFASALVSIRVQAAPPALRPGPPEEVRAQLEVAVPAGVVVELLLRTQ